MSKMILTVELNDKEWKFHYTIGENTHTSTRHICADTFIAFSNLLQYATKATHSDHDARMDTLKAKAWIEQNPEEAIELAKKQVKK